ncbi:MAG: hypothetical protein ACUVTZ_15025, partial [Armatimonadota bacterium]
MRKPKQIAFLLAAVALCLAVPRAAAQSDLIGKTDGILRAVIKGRTGPPQLRVIVTTKPGLRDASKSFARTVGADLKGDFEDGFTATLSHEALLMLLASKAVEHLSLDLPVRATMDVTSNATGAAQVWETMPGLSGEGVTVAVIDSGIAP